MISTISIKQKYKIYIILGAMYFLMGLILRKNIPGYSGWLDYQKIVVFHDFRWCLFWKKQNMGKTSSLSICFDSVTSFYPSRTNKCSSYFFFILNWNMVKVLLIAVYGGREVFLLKHYQRLTLGCSGPLQHQTLLLTYLKWQFNQTWVEILSPL